MTSATPEAWIQFKGTDICMDVRCECGVISHFDGYQAYAVQCGSCGRKYDLQQGISLLPFSDRFEPVISAVTE